MQERALARAALPDDGKKFAGADVQIDSFEHRNLDVPFAVALVQAFGGKLTRCTRFSIGGSRPGHAHVRTSLASYRRSPCNQRLLRILHRGTSCVGFEI